MTNTYYIHITTEELCQQIHVGTETVIELVEHGIVEPEGATPEEWLFAPELVSTSRRAARLRRDLGIDWTGVAMVLDLLDERERLRRENERLRRRLGRFLVE